MKPELDEKELVGAAKVLMGVTLGDIEAATVEVDREGLAALSPQRQHTYRAVGVLQDLTLYEIAELIEKVGRDE